MTRLAMSGVFRLTDEMWEKGIETGSDPVFCVQIVKRSDGRRGFEVLPKRWIVERTLGWLGKCRRLSEDYESHVASSVAMI